MRSCLAALVHNSHAGKAYWLFDEGLSARL